MESAYIHSVNVSQTTDFPYLAPSGSYDIRIRLREKRTMI